MSSGDNAEEVAELLAEGRRLWRREGDWAGAERAFTRALELDPKSAAALNDRGCLRAERGELRRGAQDLFAARRLDPDLAETRANFSLLEKLVLAEEEGDPAPEGSPWTTVSGSLLEGQGSSFADGLVAFLRAQLRVAPADQELRDDAIQEVVLRVLSLARSEDLSLADALRQVRRSSTRAWVSKLIGLAKRRRGAPLPEGELAAPERPQHTEDELLRLDALLNATRDELLARSHPTTRWRRRLVWDVYVGGLLEGVHLRRAEVVAAVRELGVSAKRARKSVLEADLSRITSALRGAEAPEGDGAASGANSNPSS